MGTHACSNALQQPAYTGQLLTQRYPVRGRSEASGRVLRPLQA